jgi:hypothetical protein
MTVLPVKTYPTLVSKRWKTIAELKDIFSRKLLIYHPRVAGIGVGIVLKLFDCWKPAEA